MLCVTTNLCSLFTRPRCARQNRIVTSPARFRGRILVPSSTDSRARPAFPRCTRAGIVQVTHAVANSSVPSCSTRVRMLRRIATTSSRRPSQNAMMASLHMARISRFGCPLRSASVFISATMSSARRRWPNSRNVCAIHHSTQVSINKFTPAREYSASSSTRRSRSSSCTETGIYTS
jgi:hypothetical protein